MYEKNSTILSTIYPELVSLLTWQKPNLLMSLNWYCHVVVVKCRVKGVLQTIPEHKLPRYSRCRSFVWHFGEIRSLQFDDKIALFVWKRFLKCLEVFRKQNSDSKHWDQLSLGMIWWDQWPSNSSRDQHPNNISDTHLVLSMTLITLALETMMGVSVRRCHGTIYICK